MCILNNSLLLFYKLSNRERERKQSFFANFSMPMKLLKYQSIEFQTEIFEIRNYLSPHGMIVTRQLYLLCHWRFIIRDRIEAKKNKEERYAICLIICLFCRYIHCHHDITFIMQIKHAHFTNWNADNYRDKLAQQL